ncbi:tetratricopeptide repeat protein [Sphingomonas sp. LY54]|uniref:tetratricopeptide repeat protein n=1 Tax=Sphingomonas sp. LY54 TaxID=3095343 RepID=UPI002D78FDCB|nr:tetratricopeptide repeat protein [Sphingomonas sp. LY54]WRP29032.1 tetratricopeptide repeat protein [Sphingomonas sp. LY54]
MGWLIFILLALASFVALWRFARFDKAALQFLGAGLLLAMAGYVWQGQPGLPGKPLPPPERQNLPDSAFAGARGDMLGQFDSAARWLTIADSFHRSGDTRNAAGVIRAGLRQHPNDPDLWVGLGNALVIHADGLMTPAAELAFQRAAKIAPEHPGPKFFYGLALAQGGKIDEAEGIWRSLLEGAPADAAWRPMVEERLAMIAQARAMGAGR